jgi:hypothetical protein
MPEVSTEAMNLFLAAFSNHLAADEHALISPDQAGRLRRGHQRLLPNQEPINARTHPFALHYPYITKYRASTFG